MIDIYSMESDVSIQLVIELNGNKMHLIIELNRSTQSREIYQRVLMINNYPMVLALVFFLHSISYRIEW